jgi:hypothetical protein
MWLKKLVMATFNDIRAAAERQQAAPEKALDPNQLSPQEIASLLDIIKQTSFMGEQVELVYNMVLKLQQQYISQTQK